MSDIVRVSSGDMEYDDSKTPGAPGAIGVAEDSALQGSVFEKAVALRPVHERGSTRLQSRKYAATALILCNSGQAWPSSAMDTRTIS